MRKITSLNFVQSPDSDYHQANECNCSQPINLHPFFFFFHISNIWEKIVDHLELERIPHEVYFERVLFGKVRALLVCVNANNLIYVTLCLLLNIHRQFTLSKAQA